MKWEVIIHGNPKGHQVFKVQDANINQLYSGDAQGQFMRVEVKQESGHLYCYYHYLIYGNIFEFDGRQTKYFGLTIRTDEKICKDLQAMFSLLHLTYNYLFKDRVLVPHGTGLKFAISSFTEELHKQVETFVAPFVHHLFAKSNTETLPSQASVKMASVSLSECEQFANSLQKGYALNISPDYPSQAELNEKTALKTDCDQKLASAQQQLSQWQTKCTQLEQQTTMQKNQLAQTEAKCQSLQQELQKMKKEHDLKKWTEGKQGAELVTLLRELSSKLPTVPQQNESIQTPEFSSLTPFWKKGLMWLLPVIAVGVIGVVIYSFFFKESDPPKATSTYTSDDICPLEIQVLQGNKPVADTLVEGEEYLFQVDDPNLLLESNSAEIDTIHGKHKITSIGDSIVIVYRTSQGSELAKKTFYIKHKVSKPTPSAEKAQPQQGSLD